MWMIIIVVIVLAAAGYVVIRNNNSGKDDPDKTSKAVKAFMEQELQAPKVLKQLREAEKELREAYDAAKKLILSQGKSSVYSLDQISHEVTGLLTDSKESISRSNLKQDHELLAWVAEDGLLALVHHKLPAIEEDAPDKRRPDKYLYADKRREIFDDMLREKENVIDLANGIRQMTDDLQDILGRKDPGFARDILFDLQMGGIHFEGVHSCVDTHSGVRDKGAFEIGQGIVDHDGSYACIRDIVGSWDEIYILAYSADQVLIRADQPVLVDGDDMKKEMLIGYGRNVTAQIRKDVTLIIKL